ncbi:MAG: metallophosphatase domain-containing protein [Candidatus Eremiobacterota bacterium]
MLWLVQLEDKPVAEAQDGRAGGVELRDMGLTLVLLSDTHSHHRVVVPPGDVLIHAGDITQWGSLQDVAHFDRFMAAQSHRYKIVIAGNHDFCFQKCPEEARRLLTHCTYLEDEALVVEGIRIYGSPWQPTFCNLAFNLPRGEKLRECWARIPSDTELLVTHGPPQGHGDRTHDGHSVGCADLLARVRELRPRLHVFGHVHEGRGVSTEGGTTFVNASNPGPDQQPAIVFEWS